MKIIKNFSVKMVIIDMKIEQYRDIIRILKELNVPFRIQKKPAGIKIHFTNHKKFYEFEQLRPNE